MQEETERISEPVLVIVLVLRRTIITRIFVMMGSIMTNSQTSRAEAKNLYSDHQTMVRDKVSLGVTWALKT